MPLFPMTDEALDKLMREARQQAMGQRAIVAKAMHLSHGFVDIAAARLWLSKNGTCENWGKEVWKRASVDCICPTCHNAFRQHPQEMGPGYGLCGDETLYLHRLCDGSLIKG